VADSWYSFFFRSPEEGAPASVAFGQFSTQHLLALLVLAIAIALVVRGYRRSGEARRRVIRLTLGIAVLALEGLRQLAYILLGTYQPSILPLHLCAIAEFCVMIDAFKPNSWCREYMYACGTWGPVCAIVFPNWANLPLFNIYCWQAFIIHACLISYILMLLVAGEFRPSFRNIWKMVIIAVVSIIVAALANNAWGTNFWFLNAGSPGSPLAPIQAATGQWYVPCLVVLVAILWTLMYLPWLRRRGKHPSSAGV